MTTTQKQDIIVSSAKMEGAPATEGHILITDMRIDADRPQYTVLTYEQAVQLRKQLSTSIRFLREE